MDEIRQINGLAWFWWRCAERQLEQRQVEGQLVQSRQYQR